MEGTVMKELRTYKINDYFKLICVYIDDLESYIIDEINTNDNDAINKFIKLYRDRADVKILIIKMNTMELITFDQLKRVTHDIHMYDYLHQLVSEGNQILQLEESDKLPIGSFVKYLFEK